MILTEELNYKEVSHEYGSEVEPLSWDESESQEDVSSDFRLLEYTKMYDRDTFVALIAELPDCVEAFMEHKSKNPRLVELEHEDWKTRSHS
ncbi:hypothetical protein COLO4_24741 [Corchorus olitorius]|uniref:Uncharacterized protein n=1 Tax=Corchorus olitorius TaxID=93759 RepID=A0A1R3I7D1_9ROSI|nr:hypothetical protein COLO4_24741 [Corchorus olitorius]